MSVSVHPAGKSCSDLGRVLVLNDPPARVLARDKFMGSRRGSWVNRSCLFSMTLMRGDGGREALGAVRAHGRGGVENKHSADVESPPPLLHVCMSIHP